MQELTHYISSYFGFTEDEFSNINAFFTQKELEKGEYFLREGQYCQEMGFVRSGILREYLHTNDLEITKWFSTPGFFAVDLSSFLFNTKARVNYQALTQVELLVISKEYCKMRGKGIPRWNEIEKLFLAKCFTTLEDRIISHISMTAEERYMRLMKFNPGLVNEVPLHQIASMLGMKAETLSRIRKKISKGIS